MKCHRKFTDQKNCLHCSRHLSEWARNREADMGERLGREKNEDNGRRMGEEGKDRQIREGDCGRKRGG